MVPNVQERAQAQAQAQVEVAVAGQEPEQTSLRGRVSAAVSAAFRSIQSHFEKALDKLATLVPDFAISDRVWSFPSRLKNMFVGAFSRWSIFSCCRPNKPDNVELEPAPAPAEPAAVRVPARRSASAPAADRNFTPEAGSFYEVALQGSVSQFKLMMDVEANQHILEKNVADDQGLTLLHYAVLGKNRSVFNHLMKRLFVGDKDAVLKKDGKGRTILNIADEHQDPYFRRSIVTAIQRGIFDVTLEEARGKKDDFSAHRHDEYRPYIAPARPVLKDGPQFLIKMSYHSEPQIVREDWREIFRFVSAGLPCKRNFLDQLELINKVLLAYHSYKTAELAYQLAKTAKNKAEELIMQAKMLSTLDPAQLAQNAYRLKGIDRQEANQIRQMVTGGLFREVHRLLYPEHPFHSYFSLEGRGGLLELLLNEKNNIERGKEQVKALAASASSAAKKAKKAALDYLDTRK